MFDGGWQQQPSEQEDTQVPPPPHKLGSTQTVPVGHSGLGLGDGVGTGGGLGCGVGGGGGVVFLQQHPTPQSDSQVPPLVSHKL